MGLAVTRRRKPRGGVRMQPTAEAVAEWRNKASPEAGERNRAENGLRFPLARYFGWWNAKQARPLSLGLRRSWRLGWGCADVFFRCSAARSFPLCTHGLRRGLRSCAASRLFLDSRRKSPPYVAKSAHAGWNTRRMSSHTTSRTIFQP